MTKITNAMVLEVVKAMAMAQDAEAVFDGGVTPADIVKYCDLTMEHMENRKASAAAARQKKREAGDELKSRVLGLLSETPQTREDIALAIGDPEISVHKIGARLTQLVNDGLVDKVDVKVDKSTKKGYVLAIPAEEE